MKIAFFEVKEDWEKKLIKKKFPKEDILIFKETINEVNINKIKSCEILSVFIYSKCDKDLLSNFKKLKLIATRSTGYDHIDLKYTSKNKIDVCNVPHYGENTVAEFTFALLLNISRKLSQSISRVKTGVFSFDGLRGFDLNGKTVGIIGFGNIGQKFAKMCVGFEMNVIVYDVFADKLEEKANEIGVKFVDLETLFKKSQIISLHIPALPSTKHIINENSFKLMKKNVIILNTSRGELIETNALLKFLNSKKVLGVGLDVLEGECGIKDELELFTHSTQPPLCDSKLILEDHIIINHPRVFVTPHNAFNTIDALIRILKTTLSNIDQLVKNKEVVENKVK